MPAQRSTVRYVDLFSGIGGFRLAADSLNWQCVFACDIDAECANMYEANFGERPFGDITNMQADGIADHDILLAGFPCQPFSIIGNGDGFADTRGTLFFDIARIIDAKRPLAFVLENVKRLATHKKGRTMGRMLEVLRKLGYTVRWNVLNALDFGLPQKRERVYVVGWIGENGTFTCPAGGVPMQPLSEILEPNPPRQYYASAYIVAKRKAHHKSRWQPAIWHENKAGNIASYPFSCALRANASYNYLLVDGERRLTPREMLRLQGFPDSFRIASPPAAVRKQAGNAVPVPVVRAVLESLSETLQLAAVPATRGDEYAATEVAKDG